MSALLEDDYDPTAVPRVLGWADALRFGFTVAEIRHLLATGRWRRVLPRTYLTSDLLTWDDRVRAALTFAGDGALLSGAAALDGLGLRSVRRPATILVLAPAGQGPHSTAWVRIRRSTRPMTRALAPGPGRVEVARAMADLAVNLNRLDDVRALVADAVRRELCRPDELRRELLAGPRRNSLALRLAIEEVTAGAWSAPEARAATALRRAGIVGFTANQRIELPGGEHLVADLLWRELRAILEIDSDAHHALAGDADGTDDRHIKLETLGYTVVHRTPAYIARHEQAFTAGIGAWLAAHAVELGKPSPLRRPR